MSQDFYSTELMIRERIGSKYQEAKAQRLANSVARSGPNHHSVQKSVGQALRKATRVVGAVIHRNKRPSHTPSFPH